MMETRRIRMKLSVTLSGVTIPEVNDMLTQLSISYKNIAPLLIVAAPSDTLPPKIAALKGAEKFGLPKGTLSHKVSNLCKVCGQKWINHRDWDCLSGYLKVSPYTGTLTSNGYFVGSTQLVTRKGFNIPCCHGLHIILNQIFTNFPQASVQFKKRTLTVENWKSEYITLRETWRKRKIECKCETVSVKKKESLIIAPLATMQLRGEHEPEMICDDNHKTARYLPAVTAGFYILHEIRQELEKRIKVDASPAIAKLAETLIPFAKDYNRSFARNLFDYLALASLGEARHGSHKMSGDLTLAIPALPELRSECYTKGINYDPRQFLPILSYIFDQSWVKGYGGKAWKNIVDHIMQYWTLNSILFVDHVIDLAHNGAIAFDKPLIWSLSKKISQGCGVTYFRDLLNQKREGSLLNYRPNSSIGFSWPLTIPESVNPFLTWAVNLRLVDLQTTVETVADTPVSPFKWGTDHLKVFTNRTIAIPIEQFINGGQVE